MPRENAADAKLLVTLIGSIRGGEPTWQSIVRHVLDPNAADLALMIGDGPPHRTLLHERASHVWTIRERSDLEWARTLDEIGRALGARNATAWRRDVGEFRVRNATWMSPLFLGPARWSATINMVMRWELKQRLVRHRLLQRYARFAVMRSDQYFGCPLDLRALEPSRVWVPEGEDYGGLCDRVMICSASNVLGCLSLIDGYVVEPSDYPTWLNPERFLKMRMQRQGLWPLVRRFPRVMFTATAAGDSTRWAETAGSRLAHGDVRVKYAREYALFRSRCPSG